MLGHIYYCPHLPDVQWLHETLAAGSLPPAVAAEMVPHRRLVQHRRRCSLHIRHNPTHVLSLPPHPPSL